MSTNEQTSKLDVICAKLQVGNEVNERGFTPVDSQQAYPFDMHVDMSMDKPQEKGSGRRKRKLSQPLRFTNFDIPEESYQTAYDSYNIEQRGDAITHGVIEMNSPQGAASEINNNTDDDCGALDLSVKQQPVHKSQTAIEVSRSPAPQGSPLDHGGSPLHHERPTIEDASGDFGEPPVVRELFSVYGFNASSLQASAAAAKRSKFNTDSIAVEDSATVPSKTNDTSHIGSSAVFPGLSASTLGIGNLQTGSLTGGSIAGGSLSNGSSIAGGSLSNRSLTTASVSTGGGAASTFIGVSQATSNAEYIKRYHSYVDCGEESCRLYAVKEHCHCTKCDNKLIAKKEEVLRHQKWHRKRDEFLGYGFLRFSNVDQCDAGDSCEFSGKQTHYHCLQNDCRKVYTSTSDVQTHWNHHKKMSEIMLEGFRRYKATDDCEDERCELRLIKTTHFHCLRPDCSFTFKQKADMEKHKAYHQKDDQLRKNGFKKYMKYESCPFLGCKNSKFSNHIHCVRPGCGQIVNSQSLMASHRRKHERQETERQLSAMRRVKKLTRAEVSVPYDRSTGLQLGRLIAAASPPKSTPAEVGKQDDSGVTSASSSPGLVIREDSPVPAVNGFIKTSPDGTVGLLQRPIDVPGSQSVTKRTDSARPADESPINTSCVSTADESKPEVNLDTSSSSIRSLKIRDESWKDYLTRYTANDPCFPLCDYLYKDHYHCKDAECQEVFKSKEGIRDHASKHRQQDAVKHQFEFVEGKEPVCTIDEDCKFTAKPHFHCSAKDHGCQAAIAADGVFSRLNHHRYHTGQTAAQSKTQKISPVDRQQPSKRRRGRPPKYDRADAVCVPKITVTDLGLALVDSGGMRPVSLKCDLDGFIQFSALEPCPDSQCLLRTEHLHYHCVEPRCHYATTSAQAKMSHAANFHKNLRIGENFEYYEASVPCRRAYCNNNKHRSHYHCTRSRCQYSFTRYSTMEQHDRKHSQAALAPSQAAITPSQAALAPSQAALTPSQAAITPQTNISPTIAPAIKKSDSPVPEATSTSLPTQQQLQLAYTGQMMFSAQAAGGLTGGLVSAGGLAAPGLTAGGISAAGGLATGNLTTGGLTPSTLTASGLAGSFMQPVLLQGASGLPYLMPVTPHALSLGGLLPFGLPSEDKTDLLKLLKQTPHNETSTDVNALIRQQFVCADQCTETSCKLKTKDHFHCSLCSCFFSEASKLRTHLTTHGIGKCDEKTQIIPKIEVKEEGEQEDDNCESDTNVSDMMKAVSLPLNVIKAQDDDEDSNHSLDLSVPSKISSGLDQAVTSESEDAVSRVLNGFSHFRSKQDCGYTNCTHRTAGVGHFHCLKENCGAGFSDRVRVLQHNARHERTDLIMGNDFRQFRVHIACNVAGCELSVKATHYHCLVDGCSFTCTDTAKMPTHRRQHQKQHYREAYNFFKVSASATCDVYRCTMSRKQTHYHCRECSASVQSPVMMGPHYRKHQEKSSQHRPDDSSEAYKEKLIIKIHSPNGKADEEYKIIKDADTPDMSADEVAIDATSPYQAVDQ